VTGPARELACGCSLDDLLAQVADGADPADPEHQRACPHCRAALAELAELWAPVRTLEEEPPATPVGLDAKVMERVSAMATHAWHAVVPERDGVTRVAAWVVAVVARRAAQRVEGGRSVRGQAAPPAAAVAAVRAEWTTGPTAAQRAGAMGIGVAGRRVVVTVQLTVAPGHPLPQLAEDVRRSVVAGVGELTGLDVVEVDVHVADLEEDGVNQITGDGA